jgi:hypothetical protein
VEIGDDAVKDLRERLARTRRPEKETVAELLHVIERLTNPPDPDDAFHVVVPSLSGYGFATSPRHRAGTFLASAGRGRH